MNRENLTFPLSIKFLLRVLVAVVVPAIIMLIVLVDSSNRISVQNLQAYLFENGSRHQLAIEGALNTVTANVGDFLGNNVNRSVLSTALRVSSGSSVDTSTIDQVSERASQLINTELLSDPEHLIESTWLITLDAKVVAPAVALNSSLPFNINLPQEGVSDSFKVGQNLIDSAQSSALVVSSRNGTTNFEIVNVILDASEKPVGFLVIDLDLDEIVFKNLTEETEHGQYDAYSFLVMPDGQTALQLLNVRLQKVVYTDTIGVGRALNGQPAGTDIYSTGLESERTVIGFYAPIEVLETRFAFVTELDRGIINAQRVEYFAQVGFPIVVGLMLLMIVITLLINQVVSDPIAQLREAMRGMITGNYELPITFNQRADELGLLGTTFIDMREQVNRLIKDMTLRLEERTRDVRVTQNISRAAIAERNLQVLLNKVVNLITESFPNIYHAQIFLVDAENEFAVLRASTGLAGQELLKRGHKLAVGSVSVIGQVTEQGQLVIARDISASNVHRQNEFLSETQAELAFPLVLGSQIIGALDVQSKQRDSFNNDQITALQTLADQITIAIENARLFEESQRLISALDVEKAVRTRRAWRDTLSDQRAETIVTRYGNDTGFDGKTLREAVLQSGQAIVGEKTDRNTIPFAVPIRLRGQTLGVVEYELQQADFNFNKVLLAEELVSRLAISLDNARLFQDSVKSADRERLVNEISAKLTSQTDINDIIETAIREVGLALRTPQVAIRFHLGNSADENGNGNGTHNGNGNHANDDFKLNNRNPEA